MAAAGAIMVEEKKSASTITKGSSSHTLPLHGRTFGDAGCCRFLGNGIETGHQIIKILVSLLRIPLMIPNLVFHAKRKTEKIRIPNANVAKLLHILERAALLEVVQWGCRATHPTHPILMLIVSDDNDTSEQFFCDCVYRGLKMEPEQEFCWKY